MWLFLQLSKSIATTDASGLAGESVVYARLGVPLFQLEGQGARLVLHTQACVCPVDGERIDFLVQLVPLGR